ncbi:hypothetical protein [Pseudobacteroides cellulosolvens]|uniref:Uncharacterized protein n=1 Tax=Pseudobacteroides cellulosolvens ATCC 35603 = DSM 2933 TaxID=398512 RepID=A0A0L6JHA2_9FIRM|nr:hypothetical protein [Pseudobacteroides cellulosolvens]KNY25108.1 hypothetical protein Bccel_0365 [Pseudobacteroides cellulosolvens ATCC 35603 = DSM 2933]
MAIVIFVIFDIIVVAIVLGLLFKFLDIRIPDKFKDKINKNPKLKATLDKAIVFIKDLDLKNKISNIKLPKIEFPKKTVKTKPLSPSNSDVRQDIANYFRKRNENISVNPDTNHHPRFGRVGVDTEPVKNDNQSDYTQGNNVAAMNQRLVPAESMSYSGSFSMEANQNHDDNIGPVTHRFTPWARSNDSDNDNSQEILNKKMFEQNRSIEQNRPADQSRYIEQNRPVERISDERLGSDRGREVDQPKLFKRNLNEDISNYKKEDVKKEKVKKEKTLFGNNKNQNKKYKIVQTGFASIFFGRNNSIVIIPYAKDIEGKGRAMDNIIYIDSPIPPHQLGEAIRQTIEVDSDVHPFTDKELIKELQVKEWSEFTQGKRYISIRYDDECGYILNTTTRNPDGSYRLNCPGGIEKIVNKDATLTDLGDTVYHLVEKCKA